MNDNRPEEVMRLPQPAPTPAPGEPAPADVAGDEDAYQRLLQAARQLIDHIHHREEEIHRLLRVTENINRGLGLEEVLEFLYQELRPVIPFNRIGCALIDERRDLVVSYWARSDRPVLLDKDFRAPLAGSTLADIVRTGQPRILNDLPAYLSAKPQSAATELIVREGMRSSLTCPLVVHGRPVGFLFFDSDRPETYRRAHVEFFQQIAGQLAVIVEKGRLYSELAEQAAVIERQNQQLRRELDLARQFQRAMIPSPALRVPGLTLAFAYRPALEVGGDILDIVPLPDGRTLVFVGDAMGHGVDSAMVMAATRTALLTAVRPSCGCAGVKMNCSSVDPAELLRRINDELYEMLRGERYVTAVCALLDPASGRAELALAGHPNPLHVSAATGEVSRPGDGGLALGLRAGVTFPTRCCRFEPGDTLVFFTDGVVEAKDARGQFYGEERLLEVVRRHLRDCWPAAGSQPGRRRDPGELLRAIEADLQGHCGALSPNDDLTVLVLQSQPEGGA
ncbi:MAG: SpoIIE family protein phosphatase [Gemmataceae bacterium]|nr:SpoIIE family protein phosphatase [Gemmataceae bacterium]